MQICHFLLSLQKPTRLTSVQCAGYDVFTELTETVPKPIVGESHNKPKYYKHYHLFYKLPGDYKIKRLCLLLFNEFFEQC